MLKLGVSLSRKDSRDEGAVLLQTTTSTTMSASMTDSRLVIATEDTSIAGQNGSNKPHTSVMNVSG